MTLNEIVTRHNFSSSFIFALLCIKMHSTDYNLSFERKEKNHFVENFLRKVLSFLISHESVVSS